MDCKIYHVWAYYFGRIIFTKGYICGFKVDVMKVWKTLMLQRKHPVKHQLLEHFQRIPTVM